MVLYWKRIKHLYQLKAITRGLQLNAEIAFFFCYAYNTSSSLALPVSWNSYKRGCMLVGGKNIRQPWASSRELISWSSCYWSAANGSSTSASVGHIDGLAIVNLLSQCCMPSSHFSSNIFFCLHRAA
jgi:hypothetical protein